MLYLPENLKKYRLLKNLTQEDIAQYLGITAQSVSKWERGGSLR
ncbi:MAG TPA: helix-turn-helix domain-containing protein [Sellimonas intestinalis]|nr:helix-turn-helix domain-containing protein [Sellimonas intestinalis]